MDAMGGVSPSDELERFREAVRMLRRAVPGESADAARARSCRLIVAQQEFNAAARKAANRATVAAARSSDAHGSNSGKLDRPLLSDAVLRGLAAGLVPWVRDAVAEAMAPLATRVAVLEAEPFVRDAGTWKAGVLYKRGQLVTDGGASWICKEPNSNARPGRSDAWRLTAKSPGRR